MSREIKFRGKRIDNGEWIYGSYHNGYILTDQYENNYGDMEFIYEEVDPETVGQYTGFKDKVEQELYEHDIIREGLTFSKIIFIDGILCCNDERIYGKLNNLDDPEIAFSTDQVVTYKDYFKYSTKVGNFFDNPEILSTNADEITLMDCHFCKKEYLVCKEEAIHLNNLEQNFICSECYQKKEDQKRQQLDERIKQSQSCSVLLK